MTLVHFHCEVSTNSLDLDNEGGGGINTFRKQRRQYKPRQINIVKKHKDRGTNETLMKITNREVLSYGLHLFTGIGVVVVGFPVDFYSLQRFSQDLSKNKFRNRSKSGS